MRLSRAMLLGCAALLLALPLRAEVFSVKLTNGATFESRYQPKQAAWDPTVVTIIDETGLLIAIPKSLISEVTSLSETKGFGKVINTTTIDLGFMPNDMPTQQQQRANAADQMMRSLQDALANRVPDQKQFVEPGEVSGVPLYGANSAGFAAYYSSSATMTAPAPGPAAPAAGTPATPATAPTSPPQ